MQWDTVNEPERKSQVGEEESRAIWGPGDRYGHTLNVVSLGEHTAAFVVGGTNGQRKQTIGVCKYDTSKELWKRPKLSGPQPAPRENHTCTTVGSKLFLFGGRNSDSTLGDLTILDTESNQWSAPQTGGDAPCRREGHAAVSLKQLVYFFGGCERFSEEDKDDCFFNDVHRLDTVALAWQQLVTSGERPSARTGHSMVAWISSLVVFGGQDADDQSLNDAYTLDTETLVWKKLQPCGEQPAPRAGHVSTLVGDKLIVFGGVDKLERKLFNDICVLDLDTLEWRCQAARGSFPRHRFSAAAALVDAQGGDLLIYGGCDEELAPTSGFFVLLTGLSQSCPGLKRLAKHMPREITPPAPARPAKRRKTVISTLTGHTAKVDEATAALYFRTISRIAEKLGVGALAPQALPEGELEARGEETREPMQEGQLEAGEELGGSAERGREECRMEGHGQNGVGKGARQVGGNGAGLLGRADGFLKAREGPQPGGGENGCAAVPPAEKGITSETDQGKEKTLVSAGVQTVYSAAELHQRMGPSGRARKLVPRRGITSTNNGAARGDPMARGTGEESPRSHGDEERVVRAEVGVDRTENGGTERSQASESCQAPRERVLQSEEFGGMQADDATCRGAAVAVGRSTVKVAPVGEHETDRVPERESAAEECPCRNPPDQQTGLQVALSAPQSSIESNQSGNDGSPPNLMLAGVSVPVQEESMLPTPPERLAQVLRTSEKGVNTPAPSAEPRPAAAAGAHSHSGAPDLPLDHTARRTCGVNGPTPNSVADSVAVDGTSSHQEAIINGYKTPTAGTPPLAADVRKGQPGCHESPYGRGAASTADAAPLGDGNDVGADAAETFGGWALIKVPPIKENPPRETIDVKLEDLLQTGFSISAAVGGQQLRGFLYSSNPKFLAIAQSLALKKSAEDQRAAAIAAAERKAARLLEKKAKEERKLEAARAAEEVLRVAAEARAEKAALRTRAQPKPNPLVNPLVNPTDRLLARSDQPTDHPGGPTRTQPLDLPVMPNPEPANPVVITAVSPPVKVATPVVARKGKRKEASAKRGGRGGLARIRPQPPLGYLSSYPPNLHVMPAPMPVMMHQPPMVMRAPATPNDGLEVNPIAANEERLSAEDIGPHLEAQGPETESLGGPVGDAGAEIGHVAIEEGMEVAEEPGHTGQEIMLYEQPVIDHYAPGMDPDHEQIEAPFAEGATGEVQTGEQPMEGDPPGSTGEYPTDLAELYPPDAPTYEAAPGAYTDPEQAYGQPEGYEPGQVVTGAVYHQGGQPGYAQGHVVYEHPPTAYYAHDPYFGTYQVTAEGYQQGHVPYHPQYAVPEYQPGYLAHDPYGHMAPVMHPGGAYGIQAPPIHYGAPVYGPMPPATAPAIDPTHITYQQQMYNMQVYGTPYDPSQWAPPPTQ